MIEVANATENDDNSDKTSPRPESDMASPSPESDMASPRPDSDAASQRPESDTASHRLVSDMDSPRQESDEIPTGQDKGSRERKFKCDMCEYGTIDNHHLRRHKENMHSTVSIKCNMCHLSFGTKFEYQGHLKTCFYICSYPSCRKKYKNLEKFNAHKRYHIKMLGRLI